MPRLYSRACAGRRLRTEPVSAYDASAMKRLWKPVAVLYLLYALSLPLVAQAPQPQLAKDKQQLIERTVTAFMAKNSAPGISVAVVEDGKFEWANGYGLADVENFVPAKAETSYRLASISKTITATAAMQLVEQGKLDLDAPAQKYCPAFPKPAFQTKDAVITTRQLLAHLSGIRHYEGPTADAEIFSTKHFDSINDALKLFAGDALLAKPGEKFHYSTHGYTVVGCVIEGASGENYGAYVKQHIFVPAGMAHTDVDDIHRIIFNRAQGYQKDKAGNVINSDLLDNSYKIPGGGLISTAEDLARFEVALLNDQLVNRKTRDLMWMPVPDAAGKKSGYALGWGTSDKPGFLFVGHGGAQQRVATYVMLQPEKKLGVVVLCDLEDVDTQGLAADLMRVLMGIAPKNDW